MRIVLIGASGMVGQGVLRACLTATDVTEIIVLCRRPMQGYSDPRINVVVVPRLEDFLATEEVYSGVAACFFCAGVSSVGLSEAAYRAVTYDLTLHVARQLAGCNPCMSIVYVSGAGADSSGTSRTMWARVRGQTENALLHLPLRQVTIFRPAVIIPEDGIHPRNRSYRWLYRVLTPLLAAMRAVFPESVLTTSIIGDAMLNAARSGTEKNVLGPRDIARLASAKR